ncbi:hypothetical protein F5887DRAFT_104583 [Amanita rubescens]|nr:hypothetical protein F5887DRAFT_104583 [Amanita rubescens]
MLFLHALIFLLFGTSVGAVPVPWGILPKSVNTCLHDCISTWRVIWTVVTGPKQRTDDYYWSTIDVCKHALFIARWLNITSSLIARKWTDVSHI